MTDRRNIPEGDRLEGLLRGEARVEAPRPAATTRKQAVAAPQTDLSELLGGMGDARRESTDTPRLPVGGRGGTPGLDGLLQGSAAQQTPSRPASGAFVSQPAQPDLDALLRPAKEAASSRSTTKKSATPSSDALASALENHQGCVGLTDPEEPGLLRWFVRSRRLLAGLAAALLMVAGGSAWINHQGRIKVPDSEVARQLMHVVSGVESFKAANMMLPDNLSVLKEFPQGAVEFEMTQWDIQLANPKLEFFYTPVGSDYYVVARYYNEAWVYKGENEPQLTRADAR